LSATGCLHTRPVSRGVLVNDVHSRLNPTRVTGIESVNSLQRLRRLIQEAARKGGSICIAGGRHAMGAQQFAADSLMLDMRSLDRVIRFDPDQGIVEVEAGVQWPAMLKFLLRAQRGRTSLWTFAQKQTGANRFCLGEDRTFLRRRFVG
jgi:FAD/FMN-containing dehydrogenase